MSYYDYPSNPFNSFYDNPSALPQGGRGPQQPHGAPVKNSCARTVLGIVIVVLLVIGLALGIAGGCVDGMKLVANYSGSVALRPVMSDPESAGTRKTLKFQHASFFASGLANKSAFNQTECTGESYYYYTSTGVISEYMQKPSCDPIPEPYDLPRAVPIAVLMLVALVLALVGIVLSFIGFFCTGGCSKDLVIIRLVALVLAFIMQVVATVLVWLNHSVTMTTTVSEGVVGYMFYPSQQVTLYSTLGHRELTAGPANVLVTVSAVALLVAFILSCVVLCVH